MFLAKVEGSVVATKKDASMQGRRLLILRPLLADEKNPGQLKSGVNTVVAMDSVGAGEGEVVLFAQGSSARLAAGFKDCPVDAVIVGTVDSIHLLGHTIKANP